MKNLLLAISILCMLTGCKSTEDILLEDNMLMGNWSWKSTDGGFGFHIHQTPQSTGKSIQLILMKGNKYTIVENDSEVSSGFYLISTRKSIYTGEPGQYITILNPKENLPVVLEGILAIDEASNLAISDNHYDGLGSQFEKVE